MAKVEQGLAYFYCCQIGRKEGNQPTHRRQALLKPALSLALTNYFVATSALANTPLPPNTVAPLFHPGASSQGLSWSSIGHSQTNNGLAATSSSSAAGVSRSTTSWHAGTNHSSKSLVQAVAAQISGVNDLNLASTSQTFQTSSIGGFTSVTLDIGGRQQTFSLDSKMTAAELVAAEQVLSGGRQALTINTSGAATGGRVDLSANTIAALDQAVGGTVASLVIPHGVRVADTLSNLDLSGSLVDLGSLTVGGTGQSANTINATNIYVDTGGSIISSPASPHAGVPGQGLALAATGAFYNSGIIASAGNLSVTGQTINNASGGGNNTGHAGGLISAAGDLALNTQSLTNSGVISSLHGNVNIETGAGSNLSLAGTGGSVQAKEGTINFNQAGNTGNGNITLSGGDYFSKQVIFNAGSGAIEADVNQITGVVNGSAGSSHILAATDNLDLGNICVKGDPTYFNSGGDITISGQLQGNPDLAVIASGNIIANGGGLDTSQATVSGTGGGTITLVAGAFFTAASAKGNTGGTGNGDSAATIVIGNSGKSSAPGSPSGGYIDLSGSSLSGISSNKPLTIFDASGTTGSGGNITMIAYPGSGKNAGSIAASTKIAPANGSANTINASGDNSSTGGDGGTVTIIGGGKTISLQNIAAGSVTIEGAVPTIGAGGTQISIVKGTVQGGSGTFIAGNSTNTAVSVNNIGVGGGGGAADINNGTGGAGDGIILKGASVSFNYLDASGGGGAGGSDGAANGGQGGSGGFVTVTATTGNVTMLNGINVSGGGGGGGAGQNSSPAGTGGPGGAGGSVSISAAGSIIVPNQKNQPADSILAWDGGAGGNGGPESGGLIGGAGGGGGGAYGGGGGGGAGVNYINTSVNVGGGGGGGAAGGGGGSGANGLGSGNTGGGGGYSQGAINLLQGTGGAGGTAFAAGTNGTANPGFTGSGGSGGDITGTPGQGGAYAAPGLGGNSSTSGLFASNGNAPTTSSGSGTVSLTVGKTTGSVSNPLTIDTATLLVNTSNQKVGVFISSKTDDLTVGASSLQSGGTLSINVTNGVLGTAGTIAFMGSANPVGTVNFTAGSGIEVDANIVGASTVNLLTATGNILNSADVSGKTITAIASTGNVTLSINTNGGAPNLANVVVGNGLAFFLTLDGTGGTVTDSKPIVAGLIAINANNNAFGTAAKPFLTDASTQFAGVTSASTPIYIKDSNTGISEVDASSTVGGSGTLISAAQNLTVGSFDFGNVTIQNTFSKTGQTATMILASFGQIGDGLGTVNISSANATIETGAGTGIAANTLVMKSTAGGLGVNSPSAPLALDAAQVSLSAPKGDVIVSDSQTAVIEASSAKGTFTFNGQAMTIAGPISGSAINLLDSGSGPMQVFSKVGTAASQSVLLQAQTGITGDSQTMISGQNVTISTIVSGNIGQASPLSPPLFTNASDTLILNAPSASTVTVTQFGKGSLAGTGNGADLSFVDTSPLSVSGPLSYGNIVITAPALTVTSSGTIVAPFFAVQAPIVTINAASGIFVNTSAEFTSKGSLKIIGGSGGSINLAFGSSLILGTIATTSITLGDKTGANDPLAAQFSGNLDSIRIVTSGTFTTALSSGTIALNATGNGGTLQITAKNIVDLADTGLAPISLLANGASGQDGGTVQLTLTGTQAVTLDSSGGSVKTGAPFVLQVNSGNSSGGGNAGEIDVIVGGNLTVNSIGIGLASSLGTATGTLTLNSSKNLLVKDDALDAGFLYSSITLQANSTAPFLVNATNPGTNGTAGPIVASAISITSGGEIVTPGVANSINASTSTTFAGTALTIKGTPGDIDTGSALTITAINGITLGDPKTGANNPLSDVGNQVLTSLIINAGKGNFSGNYSTIKTATTTDGGIIDITANNFLTPGRGSNSPILLEADGTSSAGQITLDLTGKVPLTLDSATPASAKAAAPFTLVATGGSLVGQVSVTSGGSLTINTGGIQVASGLEELNLSGNTGLAINDANLLTTNAIATLITLTSLASNPLVIGLSAPLPAGGNGIVGGITGNPAALTINALAGITINNGATVTSTGNVAIFNTRAFQNNGTASGSTTGLNEVTIENTAKGGGLTFSGIGQYTNTEDLDIVAGGAINLGPLFTTNTTFAGTGALGLLQIQTPGAITFSPSLTQVSVNSTGDIEIAGGSLVFKSATTPLTFGTVSGSLFNMFINTTASMTIGSSKGDIALNNLSSATTAAVLTSGGTLTIASPLQGIAVDLQGQSIVVNQQVTGSPVIRVTMTKSIVTNIANGLSCQNFTLTNSSKTLPKTPISIHATQVGLTGGADSINNSGLGAVTLSGTALALNYVGSASSPTTTTINGLSTSAGGLTITDNGAADGISIASASTVSSKGGNISMTLTATSAFSNLVVGTSSTISASSGSVILQDNSSSGQINIQTGATIQGSGTKPGVGQVDIVMGNVPTTGLVAFSYPANTPSLLTSGGANIFFTTSANPNGTITATGTNTLNAAGRNIIFNTNGLAASSINLEGSDTIIADPPPAVPAETGLQSNVVELAAQQILAPAPAISFQQMAGNVLQSGQNAQPLQAATAALLASTIEAYTGTQNATLNSATIGRASSPPIPYIDSKGQSPCKSGEISIKAVQAIASGVVLLAPDVDSTVRTATGDIDIARNAVVLIVAKPDGTSVYDLHDTKQNSVVVKYAGRAIALAPGRSAHLTHCETASFEEINPVDFIGYRSTRNGACSSGVKTFQAEFDGLSMISRVAPLRQMISSSDPRSRKAANSMIKTMAILGTLGSAKPYQYMLATKPQPKANDSQPELASVP